MSHRYRVGPAAREDLDAIVDYIAGDNPVAALAFIEAARSTFERIALQPSAYPRVPVDVGALQGVRRRPLTGAFSRYLVFYRVAGDGVAVMVRVLHAARDLNRILRKPDGNAEQ